MSSVNEEAIKSIGNVLVNPQRPLKERFRALFTLRNIGGLSAITCIADCFGDSSQLLKHELAYCLGQMGDERAIPLLVRVLEDLDQEPMVRHEAGEALGAIGVETVIDILEKYSKDPVVEVAETCQLAVELIKWQKNGLSEKEHLTKNPYSSVDPAPPMAEDKSVKELEKILLNKQETLFNRYRAMFSLRNNGSDEAVAALAKGFFCDSALFRHEIAYVFGQMQNPKSIDALTEVLNNLKENEMVRHECAEALGAIATEECTKILQETLKDSKRVVRESCEVALDMCEYENSPEFQYADTLCKIIS